ICFFACLLFLHFQFCCCPSIHKTKGETLWKISCTRAVNCQATRNNLTDTAESIPSEVSNVASTVLPEGRSNPLFVRRGGRRNRSDRARSNGRRGCAHNVHV